MLDALGGLVDRMVVSASIVLEAKRGFSQTQPGPLPSHDELLGEVAAAPPVLEWSRAQRRGRRLRVPVSLPAVDGRTWFDLFPASQGPAKTLVVYHHGLGEIPHDIIPRLLRLGPTLRQCDVIAVKGLHHSSMRDVSLNLTADRDRFIRCLVASASLVRHIAKQRRELYDHLVMCGVSMGGVISLIEASREPTFDLYVPFVAGPNLRDVVFESYFTRTLQARWRRRERGAEWTAQLDLTSRLRDPDGPPIRPILARRDHLFRHDAQLAAYARVPRAEAVSCGGGHITGAARVDVLGRHLAGAIHRELWSREARPVGAAEAVCSR